MESDIEEADYEEADETSSGLSTEEWEDESDSWETDNGLTTEDDSHVDNMDVTETVTPTSCYPTFIIPPREGDKVGVTSPTKSAGGKEGEASVVASTASGGGEGLFLLVLVYCYFVCVYLLIVTTVTKISVP